MLKKLTISNYVLIDKLQIEFTNGLNVITGETGAGKSIIAGALSLILGARADGQVLMDKEKKCITEGYFLLKNNEPIINFINENNFDSQDDIYLRREITPQLKSRGFINDTPANLVQLNEISEMLVSLHRQFDILTLAQSQFQLSVIDALSNNTDTLQQYKINYNEWQNAQIKLVNLKTQQSNFKKEDDYYQFQLKELSEASFHENELEDKFEELSLLNNSENIHSSLQFLHTILYEGEQAVLLSLKNAINKLQPYTNQHANLFNLQQRLLSLQVELKDIDAETNHIIQKIQFNPKRIEEINDRLNLGLKLQKKHGAKTTKELLLLKNEFEQKIKTSENIDEEILQLEKITTQLYAKTETIANKITSERKSIIAPFENNVNQLLAKVGMPNARFKVNIQQTSLQPTGADAIDFLFDANVTNTSKKTDWQPLRKVASGGELSRLMLCIKSLVAEKLNMPTLFFDEIDSGISGEAAKQVGLIIKELAKSRQVICITHQPQIAGKADAHYFVYKEIKNEGIKTTIKKLTTSEHIVAIAQMLGGENPTTAALKNAREIINN